MITQSHFDAFVNQERPTLAALPAPAGFVLAPIAPNCQPQRYARPDFVNQVRPTLAALPAPAGFELCFVAPLAQPQKFAKSDFVNQVRPTLAALPAPAGFELAYVAKNAQPLRYAQATDFVNQLRPTLVITPVVIGFELAFVAKPAQVLDHAQGFIVEPDKALPTPAISFLAAWLVNIGDTAKVLVYAEPDTFTPGGLVLPTPITMARMDASQIRLGGTPPVPGGYKAFNAQLAPTLSTLPTFVELVLTSQRAFVPVTYQPSGWSAPDKMSAATTTLLTAPWFNNDGQPALKFAYAGPNVSAPDKMSAAVVLLTSPWFNNDGAPAMELVYAASSISVPDNLVAAIVQQLFAKMDSSQVRLGGTPPVPGHFAASTAPLNVTQAATLATGVSFVSTEGQSALKLVFSRGDISAPDKMVGATPAAPTLAQWLTTDGLTAVVLKYAASSWSAPDKMVIAAVAQLFAKADYSQVRLGGTPPVPGHFQASAAPVFAQAPTVIPTGVSFVSTDGQKAVVLVYTQAANVTPDKVIVAFATTFLPGWMSTDGKPSQPQEYATGCTVEPDKANLVTAATTFLPGWMANDGQPAVKLRYAKVDWSAPDKFTGTVFFVPVFAWRGEDPYVPKWDWYAMGDTYSGPATTATAQQAFSSANLAASALPKRFQSAAGAWSAILLPIATAPLPLFVNGLAEVTPVSQPAQYAQPPELNAPDKFGQVAVAQTFLPGWMSTDGKAAVLLAYIQGDKFSGPDKANLVVPATTFLTQWMSTLGLPAVVLRYPRPESWVMPLPSLLFAVSRSMGTPYEALGRIANSKTINYEALGQLRKAAVTNYEALSRATSALKSNYEFLKGLNQSRGVNEELLKGLFPPRICNYEAKGTVLRQLTANYEASGRVFAKLTENYEVLKGAISQTKISPYEVLKGILALEKTFEEARGLVQSLGLSPYEVRLLGLAFSLALDSAVLFQALTVTGVLAGDQLDEAISNASVVPALTVKNVIVGS